MSIVENIWFAAHHTSKNLIWQPTQKSKNFSVKKWAYYLDNPNNLLLSLSLSLNVVYTLIIYYLLKQVSCAKQKRKVLVYFVCLYAINTKFLPYLLHCQYSNNATYLYAAMLSITVLPYRIAQYQPIINKTGNENKEKKETDGIYRHRFR